MKKNSWQILRKGGPGGLTLTVDFTSTGRTQACFRDLVPLLSAPGEIWETVAPAAGAEDTMSGADYVERWAKGVRRRERTVDTVIGYCVGAVFAAPSRPGWPRRRTRRPGWSCWIRSCRTSSGCTATSTPPRTRCAASSPRRRSPRSTRTARRSRRGTGSTTSPSSVPRSPGSSATRSTSRAVGSGWTTTSGANWAAASRRSSATCGRRRRSTRPRGGRRRRPSPPRTRPSGTRSSGATSGSTSTMTRCCATPTSRRRSPA